MKETILCTISAEELAEIFIRKLKQHETNEANLKAKTKTLSINQTAKWLGRSHSTIKKLIQSGHLKTIADGKRVSLESVNEYLNKTNA